MSIEQYWSVPSGRLQLTDGEVHIWAAQLDRPPDLIAALAQKLSLDERNRAVRFHFATDRSRFVAGRGLLRTILSSYLEIDPGELRFTYSPTGKPELVSPSGLQTVKFNLAHSEGLILVALTPSCAVGIDVERRDSALNIDDIAHQIMSPHEYGMLVALPDEIRRRAFYKLWTRKEAFLKATGVGIAEIEKIEVSFLPDEPARLIAVKESLQAAKAWTMMDLIPAPAFQGAVAVAGNLRFRCLNWPG